MKITENGKRKGSIFRKTFTLAGVLMLIFSVFAVASCSREDDPADNDFFAGTYTGTISYNDGNTTIAKDNGSVFVTKIASGTKYNFRFSDGIPDLNGVEFQKSGENTLISIGSIETSYIRIDNNDLKILYSKDGRTWTANTRR